MGMYDYIEDTQVKVFYTPAFISGVKYSDDINKSTLTHIGGSLRGFGTGDDLPLSTGHYKYPKAFCIYDYRGCNDVIIIKDSKYKETKKHYNMKKEDMGEIVVNNYGTEINVVKLSDFKSIKDSFSEAIKEYVKQRDLIFPDGVNIKVVNNPNYNDKTAKLKEVELNTMGVFSNKWIKKDEFKNEKYLGKLISAYRFLRSQKDYEVHPWSNPMQEYLECREFFKSYLDNNKEIIEKYYNWVDVTDLEMKEIKGIVEEILDPLALD